MKKISVIIAIMLLILLLIEPMSSAIILSKINLLKYQDILKEKLLHKNPNLLVDRFLKNSSVLSEIKKTKDKILKFSRKIGDLIVKYWERKYYSYHVINNSILLHIDAINCTVINFEKKWSNISIKCIDTVKEKINFSSYIWKQKVVFLDKKDCGYFYSFFRSQKYPVFCWEVRHSNGETKIYDKNGTQIGYGIPAPSDGFSLSGYDKNPPYDPWARWRESADFWFKKWCNNTLNLIHPKNYMISRYIKNPDLEYFYEIAHSGGKPTRFQSHTQDNYYTAEQLKEDMQNRSSIKLAVLCSCEAMRDTGPGTLSYEFRKGKTQNTVTIGYIGMGGCPGWKDSLRWQDYMFSRINRGRTFRKSFELACAQFPLICDCVMFVGDSGLRIKNSHSEQKSTKIIMWINLLKNIRKEIRDLFLFNTAPFRNIYYAKYTEDCNYQNKDNSNYSALQICKTFI